MRKWIGGAYGCWKGHACAWAPVVASSPGGEHCSQMQTSRQDSCQGTDFELAEEVRIQTGMRQLSPSRFIQWDKISLSDILHFHCDPWRTGIKAVKSSRNCKRKHVDQQSSSFEATAGHTSSMIRHGYRLRRMAIDSLNGVLLFSRFETSRTT